MQPRILDLLVLVLHLCITKSSIDSTIIQDRTSHITPAHSRTIVM